jgi:hypothetical protein
MGVIKLDSSAYSARLRNWQSREIFPEMLHGADKIKTKQQTRKTPKYVQRRKLR